MKNRYKQNKATQVTENPNANSQSADYLKKQSVDDKMIHSRDAAVNFMESMVLSFILLIGYIVIISDTFNGITCIIYTAPCIVSALARYTRTNNNYGKIKMLHLIAMFVSLIIVLYLSYCTIKNITHELNSFIVIFYPIYEIINTFIYKTISEKEEQ